MTINLILDLNDCNIISSYKILDYSGLRWAVLETPASEVAFSSLIAGFSLRNQRINRNRSLPRRIG